MNYSALYELENMTVERGPCERLLVGCTPARSSTPTMVGTITRAFL